MVSRSVTLTIVMIPNPTNKTEKLGTQTPNNNGQEYRYWSDPVRSSNNCFLTMRLPL